MADSANVSGTIGGTKRTFSGGPAAYLVPDSVGEALEHAHDPGADPALQVLERALVALLARVSLSMELPEDKRQLKLF